MTLASNIQGAIEHTECGMSIARIPNLAAIRPSTNPDPPQTRPYQTLRRSAATSHPFRFPSPR